MSRFLDHTVPVRGDALRIFSSEHLTFNETTQGSVPKLHVGLQG